MWMPHGTLHTFLEVHDDRLAVADDETYYAAGLSDVALLQLLDIANGPRYRRFSSRYRMLTSLITDSALISDDPQ